MYLDAKCQGSGVHHRHLASVPMASVRRAFECVLALTKFTGKIAPSSQIEALTKKLDEINAKIDALSQQILKIEQQTSHPVVMVGEATPSGPPVASGASSAGGPNSGNTHVVAKGETLTAIAKQHKVTVEDLQKFNHIEDGRKLQAGQTILIPAPSAAPSGSASASPSPSASE